MPKKAIDFKSLQMACANLPIVVPEQVISKLKTYLELLMQWNKVMNLVGAKNWQDCLANLLVDSFYVADFFNTLNLKKNPTTWDLGAGAGLPGIVLRMLWLEGDYFLVEAREKRSLFLQTVLSRIDLQNTYVFHGRVEKIFENKHNLQKNNLAPEQNFNKPIPSANVVISRAFMPWKDVLTLVQGHVENDAQIIFLTLEPANKQELQFLGWKLVGLQSYSVEGNIRYIWSLQKK